MQAALGYSEPLRLRGQPYSCVACDQFSALRVRVVSDAKSDRDRDNLGSVFLNPTQTGDRTIA